MKRGISLVLATLFTCFSIGPCAQAFEFGAWYNDFFRDDRSIKNIDGEVVYKRYYDYPYMKEKNPHADKINAAIAEDREKHFAEDVTDRVDATAENPYISRADAETAKNADGILSLKVTVERFNGDKTVKSYYGLNFDVNTGERLTLAEAFNMTEAEAVDYVKAKMEEYILIADMPLDDAKEITEKYAAEDYGFYLDNKNVYICYSVGLEGVVIECPITNPRIRLMLNGNRLFFEQMPVIVDGRVLVPLRGIFEALGATVDWNNDTRTVVSEMDEIKIELTIGENVMAVNGEEKALDVPACIIKDRTMVPVRAIAEAFGCNVEWNDEEKTVYINQINYENTPEGAAKEYLRACAELDIYAIIDVVTSDSMFYQYVENGTVDMKSIADATYKEMGLKDMMDEEVYNYFLDMIVRVTDVAMDRSTYVVGEAEYSSEYEAWVKATMHTLDTSALASDMVYSLQNQIQERIGKNYADGESNEEWFEIIDMIEKAMLEKIDELDMKETDGELPVVKRDGRWLVYTG